VIRKAAALLTLIAAVAVLVPLGSSPVSSSPILMGRVHASYQPTDGKIFVLVLGSDARTGNPDNVNVDAIHIAGVNAETMKGGILNFPRDSWVSIPGYGEGRINEALHAGGPELVAETLEGITGITIDYWVLTGFEGFVEIIDAIGGVKINIPTDVYDSIGSGAKIPAGTQNLGAEEALSYVRTRKAFADGDISRTTNQGRFLIAMLEKLRRQVEYSPTTLFQWTAAAREHARFDLTAGEMFRLGVLASQVDPADVGNVTVPVSYGSVGAASVVFIAPGAADIYKELRETGALKGA
jgi:LCP family protein required for cell wall assembly